MVIQDVTHPSFCWIFKYQKVLHVRSFMIQAVGGSSTANVVLTLYCTKSLIRSFCQSNIHCQKRVFSIKLNHIVLMSLFCFHFRDNTHTYVTILTMPFEDRRMLERVVVYIPKTKQTHICYIYRKTNDTSRNKHPYNLSLTAE